MGDPPPPGLAAAPSGPHGGISLPDAPAVLHLAGRITDAVFSFLGPATDALGERGIAQSLVFIDDPEHRHLLARFDASVRLEPTPADGSSLDTWAHLLDAYCEVARTRWPAAAHLHGFVCALLGSYAARFRGIDVPTYFSPHGSRLLSPAHPMRSALSFGRRPLSSGGRRIAIASTLADARSLETLTGKSIALLESPVGEAFFGVAPDAVAAAPVVVTGARGANPEGAALYAQCAVLLADQCPGIRFVWIGTAEPESMVRLQAAQVVVRDAPDDVARAACLQGGRVFVAPAGGRGFPVFLVEAMAAGLPCVAWDTPFHRDVIVDGETGLLCTDIGDAIDQVAELVASPELCQRLGRAARAEARRRFDGRQFRDSLFGLYASQLARRDAAAPGVSNR